MKNSLKQELFKFNHQKTPFYGIITLLLLMIYTIFSGTPNESMVSQAFGAGQWLAIIIITIGSTFITMEYRNNTMLTLLYKSSHKIDVYASKLLVIILYSAFLLLLSFVFTLILKSLFLGNKYQLFASYKQTTLMNTLLLNLTGTFIYMLFIVTLAFLLIYLFRNNAVVICLGLIIAFLGSALSSVIMDNYTVLISIIKWNPLNMIYVINQLASTKEFIHASHLNNGQLIAGNISYTLIFIFLGYLLFKNRRI